MAHDAFPISDETDRPLPGYAGTPVGDGEAASLIDGGAIDRVLLRFGGLMRRAAQARGLRGDEVDDVLQDIRIRLWKTSARDENLDALGASYLHRVAMSAVIDYLRRRAVRREDALDRVMEQDAMPMALHVAPVDTAESSELARRLAAALNRMVSNRRLVVQLHLEGYERHEMARMTGWTEAKVRNLLYRGLDDLRALLRSDGEETP